jgi:hypothetical protein
VAVNPEHQRIIQAARPLQNRATAAASAEDAQARLAARRQIHFPRHDIGISGHDKTLLRLPKAQDLRAGAVLARVQQSLVARQIGGGGGEREIKMSHDGANIPDPHFNTNFLISRFISVDSGLK